MDDVKSKREEQLALGRLFYAAPEGWEYVRSSVKRRGSKPSRTAAVGLRTVSDGRVVAQVTAVSGGSNSFYGQAFEVWPTFDTDRATRLVDGYIA